MPPTIFVIWASLGYAGLGLACIATGVRARRGIGNYKVSRGVKVSYEELPLRERIRTSNALFALSPALLSCATFTFLPVPVVAALFFITVSLVVVYMVIQVDLRRAAQEIARTKEG